MDGLLDSDKIKVNMQEPKRSPQTELELILAKGIDYELLDQLKTITISPLELENLSKIDLLERVGRLELLVERLLIRTARLELENEYKTLEIVTTAIQLVAFINEFSTKVTQIYNHFFSDGK